MAKKNSADADVEMKPPTKVRLIEKGKAQSSKTQQPHKSQLAMEMRMMEGQQGFMMYEASRNAGTAHQTLVPGQDEWYSLRKTQHYLQLLTNSKIVSPNSEVDLDKFQHHMNMNRHQYDETVKHWLSDTDWATEKYKEAQR